MAQRKLTSKETTSNAVGKGNGAALTIDDIARVAGVSVSTVSRILNDKPDVSSATRQRVKQVIEELGYSPHTLAQRLAASRSRSIALIFPLTDRIDRGEIATFIVQTAFTAEKENYLFSLVAAPPSEARLLNLYRSAQVEGVILMEVHMQDWRVNLLKNHHYPFVMLGRCADNAALDFVDLDFEAAIVFAVDHLVELGHRRIAFLHSELLRQQGYGPAVRSFQGYEVSREKHNVDLFRLNAETISDAVLALKESRATALVLGVHTVLIPEFMYAVSREGYRIPDDLSVVCLQADEIAKNLIRPMTSLSFDIKVAAEQAATILIDSLEGRSDETQQIVLPPRLVVRESTKSLA